MRRRVLRILAGTIAFLAVVDGLYLAAIRPDWATLAKSPISE